MSTQHKHAEVLRAIADGVPMSEFEAICHKWKCDHWYRLSNNNDWLHYPNDWEIRRKPKYIMVNGFKVPKPLDVMPKEKDLYFIVELLVDQLHQSFTWCDGDNERIWFKRGILHSTKEAAIAHAKAMLGIDPEWSE